MRTLTIFGNMRSHGMCIAAADIRGQRGGGANQLTFGARGEEGQRGGGAEQLTSGTRGEEGQNS